jgi:putative sterol carrier protein
MVSSSDLIQMVSGKLNAANAIVKGRLRVAGNSRLALGIGPILLEN